MITEEAVRALTALAGVVLAQDDIASTQDEICRIARSVLPQTAGSSLTTFTDEGPRASAASDEWARALDELQFSEHEGPCLDCVRTGNAFRIRDLEAEQRWPNWGPRAAAQGVRSVISLPLAAEGRRIGALNLYSREPDAYDAEAASVAEIIAAHAGLAAQVAASFFSHRQLGEQLRAAMASRETIDLAKGILMARQGLDREAAFTALVELSQRSNRKLRDVAQALVEQTGG